MKIVVVDGGTLNPGDLTWDSLGQIGTFDVYAVSLRSELLDRCRDAEAVLANKAIFDREIIEALPKLKYLGVTATGYNNIDTAAAAERGIVVTNVPTYGTESVAQMVFALLLELAHGVGHHSRTVRDGRWTKSSHFCYWDFPLHELSGLTLGIVGCGRIGLAVARLGEAFGMKLLGCGGDLSSSKKIRAATMDGLFRKSDVVTLHCPLTPETRELVNAARLGLMKKTAFLINTSRGPLVNERDLADALNGDRIAGAGLDVLSLEPPRSDNPLFSAKNCIITPHIAWATHEARRRLLEASIANLRAYVSGRPRNVVGRVKATTR